MSFKSFSTSQTAPAKDKPADNAKDAAAKDGTAPKVVTAVNDTVAEPKA
jgi:hypothetical protein